MVPPAIGDTVPPSWRFQTSEAPGALYMPGARYYRRSGSKLTRFEALGHTYSKQSLALFAAPRRTAIATWIRSIDLHLQASTANVAYCALVPGLTPKVRWRHPELSFPI